MQSLRPLQRRPIHILSGLLLALVGLECIEAPLSPILPSTDIQLSIPIADRLRTVLDFVSKDTTTLKQASDGSFYFTDVQRANPTPIPANAFSVKPQPTTSQVNVGQFTVDSVSLPPATLAPFPQGAYPFFPRQATVPPVTIDNSTQFDYVAITSGSITLTVTNTFPKPISFPNGIVLRNNSATPLDTVAFANFTFGTINQNQTVSSLISLNGKFLRGKIKTDSITIRLQDTTAATVNSGNGLTFKFSSTQLAADSAAAVVPQQTVLSVLDSTITLDDSVSVNTATFRSGSFTARLTNSTGINVGVFLRFDNFVNPVTGNTMRIQANVGPNSILTFPVTLDTVNISNSSPQLIGSRLEFGVGISTLNSGGQKSTVSSKGFVKAEFLPSPTFVIKSVTGRIKPTPITILSGASGFSLGEVTSKFTGSLTFDSVRIALNLGLSGGFPTDYNLHLVAMNRKVTPAKVESLYVPPATPSNPSARGTIFPSSNQTTSIVLDNSAGLNTFLSKFFPNFPDTFIVRGNAVINPVSIYPTPQGVQTIYDTSKLYMGTSIFFPLKIGIGNSVLADTVNLDTSGVFPREFVRSVKQGSMYFAITNNLPLQLSFQSTLIGRKLSIPAAKVTIAAATVDPASGISVSPQLSVFTISLTGADMDSVNNAKAMAFRFDVATSSGSPAVKVRATDFIKIRVSANMVYTLNKPK